MHAVCETPELMRILATADKNSLLISLSLGNSLLPHGRAVSLLEADGFTFTREFGQALEQAEAAVPAQHSVIVSLRPDLFCLLEAFHCLLEAGMERLR